MILLFVIMLLNFSHMSSSVKGLELPSQSLKFRFGKGTSSLEKAKMQIHKYLKVRA